MHASASCRPLTTFAAAQRRTAFSLELNDLLGLIEPANHIVNVKLKTPDWIRARHALVRLPVGGFCLRLPGPLSRRTGRPADTKRAASSAHRSHADGAVSEGSPTRPRELATTSQAIHEHDRSVRNLRGALVAFHDLGTRLLAIGESEPAVRILMSLLGFNVVQAGRALIALSRTCAMAGIDSDENRRAIGRALHVTRIALGTFRPRSRDELFNIRLEPMYLHEARNRIRLHGRPLAPRRAGRLPQHSQGVPGRIASAS